MLAALEGHDRRIYDLQMLIEMMERRIDGLWKLIQRIKIEEEE